MALDCKRDRNPGLTVSKRNPCSRRPVVDAALLVPEPLLKKITVLAQIVKKARDVSSFPLAESVGEVCRKCRDRPQVLADEFPLASRVFAMRVEFHAPTLQQTLTEFSESSKSGSR